MDLLIMTMVTCLLLILQKMKVKLFNLKCGGLANFSDVFFIWATLDICHETKNKYTDTLLIQNHKIQVVAGSHTLFGLQSNETH